MGHLPHLDDRELDRLLAGRGTPADDEHPELVAFVRGVRQAHADAPDAGVEAQHLAAMAEAARTTPVTVPAPRRRGLSRRLMPHNRYAALAAKVSVLAATAAVASGGLAVAGVDLPDPADDAFQRVGISLPNQAAGKSDAGAEPGAAAERVRALKEAVRNGETQLSGCEYGHAIAAAARGEELPAQAREACAKQERAEAKRREDAAEGKREAGEQKRERGEAGERKAGRNFGAETSRRAKQQRTATPQERSRFGPETADRARQLGQGNRPEGAGPPASAGRPEGAGPPAGAGRPEGAGPPASAGRPESAGPPAGAGRPEGAGPPAGAGRP